MNTMDKRAFLAFVLSMLLFLAFYWWYSPVMKAEQQRKRQLALEEHVQDSLATVTAGGKGSEAESLGVETPGKKPEENFLSFAKRAPGKTYKITVSTPLYEVVLRTAGAEIVSAKLLKYQTAGEPVELIRQFADTAAAGFSSLVLIGREEKIPLKDIQFEPYKEGWSEPVAPGSVIRLGGRNSKLTLIFRAAGEGGKEITRYYGFDAESYVIKSGVRFRSQVFPFVRKIGWSMGPGLRSTELNKYDDYTNFRGSIKLGEQIHKRKPGNFGQQKTERFSEAKIKWISLQTKYFMAAMIPQGSPSGEVQLEGSKAENIITASMELPAYDNKGEVAQEISIYLGPMDVGILKSLKVGLEKNVNMGYKWIRPLSRIILWSLIGLHKVIPNYGLVIIILSAFTKILFYRLTHKSFKSMRDMQRLQPKLQALKEKYKEDKQKLSAETMKLYKEAGVNPLGGCLPMLLQAPVFIALFSVLKYTIELRGAGFVWWINDLSQQDVLYTLPFSLPFLGQSVSILPLMMGAAMLLQSKIGGSLTGSTPGAAQPKGMTYLMPIVFTFLFYRMPSGLVLYWFVNNILSIGQQYYINREVKDEKQEEKAGITGKKRMKKKNTGKRKDR